MFRFFQSPRTLSNRTLSIIGVYIRVLRYMIWLSSMMYVGVMTTLEKSCGLNPVDGLSRSTLVYNLRFITTTKRALKSIN